MTKAKSGKIASLSKVNKILVLTLFIILCLANVVNASPLIEEVYTDKSRYNPGETAVVTVELKNTTGSYWSGNIGAYPRFLGKELGKDKSKWVDLNDGEAITKKFYFNLTDKDYRGYLVEIWCWKDNGEATERGATAIDYSSSWEKFPRYGYLTNFDENADVSKMIDPMKKYHINAVQFYDFADEHHILYRDGYEYWQDIAKREPWISKSKIQSLISQCHDYEMLAMAYQLINGGYDKYWEDGPKVSWGLFKSSSNPGTWNQDVHDLSGLGWETEKIWLFNPLHTDWQNWIAGQVKNVFDHMNFDGWHMDTLGYRGDLWNWDGEYVDLDSTYATFVNNVRADIGTQYNYVMNTVSNYGEANVAQKAKVDIIYSELWDKSDEDDFYDLKTILKENRDRTLKNMVIAGYMNYNYSKNFSKDNPGYFNEASVLLADAAIFANGGWHIELGDGENMLSNEYFPNKNLIMSEDLKGKLYDYYNFAVAYENLLRDSVYEGKKRIDFEGVPASYDGSADTVWKLSKWKDGEFGANYYDITHLINLRGCDHTEWRDPNATFSTPNTIYNKKVRMYYDNPWGDSKVWYASPDFKEGKAVQVTSYERHYDSKKEKWYVEFTLPKLKYWTMVWLERHF